MPCEGHATPTDKSTIVRWWWLISPRSLFAKTNRPANISGPDLSCLQFSDLNIDVNGNDTNAIILEGKDDINSLENIDLDMMIHFGEGKLLLNC